MDEAYVEAVMTFFVRLWDAGWIYRANRIVNWCPYHQTAISDLEVEHVEMDDTLTYVRYPFADGEGGIPIATVRPATILADVAVAVHPDDPRYRDAIGREVVVPFVERRVPVIADERVDPEFGTGALKVTPGHDPMDFEIGRDHGLETLTVIGAGRPDDRRRDSRGSTRRRPTPGSSRGPRSAACWRSASRTGTRSARASGATRGSSRSSRCSGGVAMEELATPALEALRERRVRYHPESQHRFAIESLEEAPDWCVSRQLWWGHQIPIWTCPDGHLTCAWPPPDACAECGSGELTRDPDVLDTWFSSALWPFATLGWPDETPELERYYPGDVNSTAREIIRLWENRMIFSGLELLGEIPFTDVIIHSTVLAADGRRMSKSLGTGVDPLRADRGTRRRRDALRPAQDLLDPGRPLLGRRDRGGPQAREQALERRPADPPAGGGRRRPRRARARSRSAGSSPGSTPPAPRSRRRGIGSTSRRRRASSTTSRSTTSATGTPRRQAAPVRRRRGLPCDGARGARAAARAPAPADAARDRGDLVAPSRPDCAR